MGGLPRPAAAVGGEARSSLALLPEPGTGITQREALIADAGVVIGGDVSRTIDTKPYLIGRIYAETASDEVARFIEYDRAWAANHAGLDVETG